jgi:hypothetical protein
VEFELDGVIECFIWYFVFKCKVIRNYSRPHPQELPVRINMSKVLKVTGSRCSINETTKSH